MYVCICKGITDKQIREEVCKGACSLSDICKKLGVATQCGKCSSHAKEVLKEHLNSTE